MTYRPWKPKKEEPPKDFTWSCFCFCLKYGGLILLGLWLYGVFFQNPSDKNNPTPIPVVAATEKPRLLTVSYEQTADADQPLNYSYRASEIELIDSNGCPEGCTYHKEGCDIKGNISYNSGEKIYHTPGQEYYSDTVINTNYGERWFCAEIEAKANGWRKSYE